MQPHPSVVKWWILGISSATLVCVLILILLVLHVSRKRSSRDHDVDHRDGVFLKILRDIGGRLQWLVSNDIARELQNVKNRKGDDAIPPHEETPP